MFSDGMHLIAAPLHNEIPLPPPESLSISFSLPFAYHEFRETCRSVTFYFVKKDSKRCCDTITLESIHTKDESKHGSAFAFIFGMN